MSKMMLYETWNAPAGFNPSKSAPSSPSKPPRMLRTKSESFHITHKVPVGDTPYVRAKNVQLVEKDPEKSIPLFWAAINAGDRVDSALKDMAIVMKQQNRSEEAIEAIKSLRIRCSEQSQESLDNILLDLYKRCGRLDDQIELLRHKLFMITQGVAFNGKRTKTARSQGKKFQVSVKQEATRLLGNLGWALMQRNNYVDAEDAYRRALAMAPDNNKMCNLGICLMKQGRIREAKEALKLVKSNVSSGVESHIKAFERAQQMLHDLESSRMNEGGGDPIHQKKLFEAFLGSSSIWQPQPCKDRNWNISKSRSRFLDENLGHQHIEQHPKRVGNSNSLNIEARPFVSSKIAKEQLKRMRSENAIIRGSGCEVESFKRRSLSPEEEEPEEEWKGLLPDAKDFEEAIMAAVLDAPDETKETAQRNVIDTRFRVFEDITQSLSQIA